MFNAIEKGRATSVFSEEEKELPIGKQRGRQMPLVAVPVFRHPHPLPLLWSDAAGLQLLFVDGCHTLDSILPGLEDGNIRTLSMLSIACLSVEKKRFTSSLSG